MRFYGSYLSLRKKKPEVPSQRQLFFKKSLICIFTEFYSNFTYAVKAYFENPNT